MNRRAIRVSDQEGHRYIAIDKIISVYVSKDAKHAEVTFVDGVVFYMENEFDIKNLIGVFSHG